MVICGVFKGMIFSMYLPGMKKLCTYNVWTTFEAMYFYFYSVGGIECREFNIELNTETIRKLENLETHFFFVLYYKTNEIIEGRLSRVLSKIQLFFAFFFACTDIYMIQVKKKMLIDTDNEWQNTILCLNII